MKLGKLTLRGAVLSILPISYLVTYVALSTSGTYQAEIVHIGSNDDGRIVVYFCKRWCPFPLFDDDSGNRTLSSSIFYPLIRLDRGFVHRDRQG